MKWEIMEDHQIKRYELLSSLPAYGPMYIPVTETGEPFYSEGVVVRFYRSDQTSWVANFEPGWTSIKEVHELKDTANLLVVACGTCYVMDPNQPKPVAVFGLGYSEVIRALDGKLILQDQTDLTVVETDGTHWHTERISWDGMKNLQLEKHIIKGLSYDPMNDAEEWVEFSYNIETRKLYGGSYNRYEIEKKPWWKFW